MKKNTGALLITLVLLCLTSVAIAAELPPGAVIESYAAAAHDRDTRLQGATMDVDISARLPKLNRQGRLHALRKISSLGRITYEAPRFEGDNSIKSQVIARYLTAETQTQEPGTPTLAITPANYKFQFDHAIPRTSSTVYVYRVSPRKKRVGLFRGELWIDAATYMPLRESGRFVKNPSFFVRKVQFIREYQLLDGVAVPLRIESVIDTRIVGKAEITIDFSNVALAAEPASSPIIASSGQ